MEGKEGEGRETEAMVGEESEKEKLNFRWRVSNVNAQPTECVLYELRVRIKFRQELPESSFSLFLPFPLL